MTVDPAFVSSGRTPGMEIWRIEKLQVVAQIPTTYGEFYTGDSYILLNTKCDHSTGKFHWDIHFWLGKETSQDEKGIAAYKSVELDDHLGGAPVQHREVQEHESQLFLSYFRKGITYLAGGIESGFKKVIKGQYEKRLFHIKGKRNVRVRQVKCHCESLNQGDVFILDWGQTIHVWNGPGSGKMERIKGAEVAKRLRDDERGGKAIIRIIDEKWNTDMSFFKDLGSKSLIPPASEGGDDTDFERIAQEEIKLYRVSDETGSLVVAEINSKPLLKDHLEPKDCFILDCGPSGIFVWVGKACTKNEKRSAWRHAMDFLSYRGYPEWTKVTRVVQSGETPVFKQYFFCWRDDTEQEGLGIVHNIGSVAKINMQEKFDINSLHRRKSKREEILPDDGDGNVKVWKIENNDMVQEPDNTTGMFYNGDCYVILYTYNQRGTGRVCYIIYFWQGCKSTIDERAGSAIFAQRLDEEELSGRATQIRVVQGREPEHFLRLFQGKMIIFMGGVNNTPTTGSTKLFHIKGSTLVNTKAVEVKAKASSLNSNDVFALVTADNTYLWRGKGSNPTENLVAENVVGCLGQGRIPFMIEEGYESTEFWELIGGEEPHATLQRLEESDRYIEPRLFQCSNAVGKFRVEEIIGFSQEDLDEDDVMLLDTFDEIFVWVGKGANAFEKQESLKTALEYIRTDPAGRTAENTLIFQVRQRYEPPNFIAHFHGWDPMKWSQGKSYEDMKRELGEENAGVTKVQDELAKYNQYFSYEDLTKIRTPDGVDKTCKQKYLSDADFLEIFGITKTDFQSKPAWKQVELKKKVHLF